MKITLVTNHCSLRKSSVQQRNGSLISRADPRNIGEKQFIHNSIRILIEYLTDHNFDHTISPKILTRPSSKDFNNIMSFLFKQIDPNFDSTEKLEDEIISMFKHLRYPYSIPKTSLVAVGSPHTWPALLASIMWVIELLAYDEQVTKGAERDTDLDFDDPSTSEKAFLAYLREAYTCFLSGDDVEFKRLEEQFFQTLENKNSELSYSIRSMDEESDSIQSEIVEMDQKRSYLPILYEKKRDYERDLSKFQQLIEQLQKHSQALEAKVAARKTELQTIHDAISIADADIAALRQRVATQSLSAEDVLMMMEEKQRLQAALEAASEARAVMQRRVWEAERSLRVKVSQLEDAALKYAAAAEDLQQAPPVARLLKGHKISLHIDVR